MFSRLFRRIPAPATASRPTPPRHRARLKLVELEDRSVPTTFTWQGVTGDSWSLGTNWDQGTAPTTGADVVIDNGTTPAYNTTVEINTLTVGSTSGLSVAGGALTVDADSTWNGGVTIAGGTVHVGDVVADVVHASNVTLSSGTLEGPGSLIASGLFTWTGGNMDVPFDGNGNPAGGQTITNGSLAITANGQSIRGRTLTVNGGATLTGAGTITGNTGAVFNVNSLFNIQSDADFSWGFGTIPVMAISATGTLRKSGGDGDTFSLFAVNNNGAVEVKSGNLLLQNGGASTGHFEVDANHILVFSQSSGGNTDLNSGASVASAGTVLMPFGIVNFKAGSTYSSQDTIINGVGNGSTAVFDNNATTGTLTLANNSVLSGAGILTVNGAATWSGGSMSGSGQTIFNGSLTIDTTPNLSLTQRTLTVNGGATLTDAGTITGNSEAHVNVNSLFDIQSDADFNWGFGFIPILTVGPSGELRKSGGAGESFINWIQTNNGTVNAASGQLHALQSFTNNAGQVVVGDNSALTISNGGTSTGDWDIAATGALTFNGGTYLLDDGTDVTGAGLVVVKNNGTLNVGDAAADVVKMSNLIIGPAFDQGTVNATGTLHVSGPVDLPGTGILGGSGDITIGGLLTLFHSTVFGPGTVSANGGLSINAGGQTFRDGCRFNNNGTATWTEEAAGLTFKNGAVFNNNGTFDLQFNGGIGDGNFGAGLPNAFNNNGLFKKTGGTSNEGAGAATIGVPFNNSGTVDLQIGTLTLRGNGTSTGPWTLASNATLDFADGTWDLEAGSTVTGAGRCLFETGIPVNFADAYSVGSTEFQSGGDANFNGNSSTTTLTFGGGDGNTLGGSGDFTVNGLLTWHSGFVTGTGSNTLFAKGDITIAIQGGSSGLDHRHLDLAVNHTATWLNGSQGFALSNGAVFNNNGTFDDQADSTISAGGGAPSVFINNGTFKKSAGTGATTLQAEFNNAGTIDEQTGTLSLTGGLTNFPTPSTAQIDSVNGATESGTTVTITTDSNGHGPVFVGQQVTINGVSEAGYNGTFIVTAVPSKTTFQYTAPTSGLPNSGNGSASFLSTSTLTGGAYLISGTFQFTGANIVTNAANIVLNGPASAILNQSTGANALANFATNTAAGNFTIQNGRSFTTGGDFSNAGNVVVGGGSIFTTGGAGKYTQTGGTTSLAGGTLFTSLLDMQGGVLTGNGPVFGNLASAGQVNPGDSLGILSVVGDYIQAAGGALNVDIGGLGSNQFDGLGVNGNVSVDGALNVNLTGGFAPAVGDTFVILNKTSGGSTGGAFSNLAEGDIFDIGPSRFSISYHGGDGNDVALTRINITPTLDAIPDPSPVLEDVGTQTINLTGIGAGGVDAQTLTVTASSSNPGLIPNPTVNYTSPSATGSISYAPAANRSGTAVITVTITDNGGTASGGGNTFSRTFTVTVTPVNDAPTLDAIPDPNPVPVSAGTQTVNLSGIGAGGGEAQTLTLTAVSSNPALIPIPTVVYSSPDATGSLSYTPVAGQSGTAVITVTVADDGGTANGGNDTTTRTFTVTVAAPVATTTTITATSPAPSTFGEKVTFSVTVTPSEGNLIPTGTLTIKDGDAVLGTSTELVAVNGVATATFVTTATQLGTGSHAITAVYAGNELFVGSRSTELTQTVLQAATTTVFTTETPTTSVLGATVTLAARVTAGVTGAFPSGTVRFLDGAVVLGEGNLTIVGGIATATLVVPAGQLALGAHAITASYSGDTNFAASTSTAFTHNVNPLTALPDTYFAKRNHALKVPALTGLLANDLTASAHVKLVKSPLVGRLVLSSDGSFKYFPPTGFLGKVTFKYRIVNDFGVSLPVLVTIKVKPPSFFV